MKARFLTAHSRLFLPVLMVAGLALPLQGPAQTVDSQPLAEIAAAAETHARGLLEGQELAGAEVKASALDTRLRLKLCDAPLETSSNDSNLRGGRVTVGVRCTGAAPWLLYVPVAITAHTTIVVIEGPLPRGTILNAAHLRLEERPLTALPPQYLSSTEQLLGRELTRPVTGATIATPNMVQARDLVAKGQDVTILATSANIQVRMAGVALQKGQQGERIDVKNATSGKTVQAVIVDAGTVEVRL
jgi:flagellar basal body P-ring formation protein FlgA